MKSDSRFHLLVFFIIMIGVSGVLYNARLVSVQRSSDSVKRMDLMFEKQKFDCERYMK